MPAPGDQHKSNSAAAANPFIETEQLDNKQQVTTFTARQIATLQGRLDKNLGPEYISSRPGAGGQKVHYLQAEKVINLANEVFGFNGWSSSIQNIQIDFVDENPQTGKVTLGLSVIIRVTLKDGTYHEDIGYGHVENAKGKAAAFEKAKKQGTSDGLKRSLRNFGRVLGNCVYDKDYLSRVTKMKVGAGKWDPNDLHRHSDFAAKKGAAVKPESNEVVQQPNGNHASGHETGDSFEEFDDGVFDDDELDNPDEFVLPAEPRESAKRLPPPAGLGLAPSRAMTTPSKPPNAGTNGNPKGAVSNGLGRTAQAPNPSRSNAPAPPQQSHSANQLPNGGNEQSSSPGIPLQHFNTRPSNQTRDNFAVRGTGFFSARAAESIDENNNVTAGAAPVFDPKHQSKSIRRDPNVDHTKSMRLLRNLNPDSEAARQELEQQQEPDQLRKTPAPPKGPQSPIGMGRGFNAGQYRPPTRRGPDGHVMTPRPTNGVSNGVDRVLQTAQRPPLTDVSNMANQHQATATTLDGTDAKRQRLSGQSPRPSAEHELSGEAG